MKPSDRSAISLLALVHGLDHVQLGQLLAGQLPALERLRNHADDLAAGAQRRIGDRTHQAYATAAVDQRDAASRQHLTHLSAAVRA